MFGNVFGTSKPRPQGRDFSFRPELEHLEGRLAPAGGGPGPDHGPPGPPPGHDHGPPGPPPPAQVNINAHDSFNTNINDSFNTAVNNITVNQFFNVVNNNTTIVQQNFITNAMSAAQQNLGALIGLVEAEVLLAADTLAALEAANSGANNLGLVDQIHGLQLSIQTNPLEATPNGEAAGYLAFDLALLHAAHDHSND